MSKGHYTRRPIVGLDQDEAYMEAVIKRAEKRRWSHPAAGGGDYFVISARTATGLVQSCFGSDATKPGPGREVSFEPTRFEGRRGHWVLTNRGGGYEIRFSYAS